MALNTALLMAPGISAAVGSPAPQGTSCGTIDQINHNFWHIGKLQNRIACPIDARHLGVTKLQLFFHHATDGLNHIPFDLVSQTVWIDDLSAIMGNEEAL